VNTAGSGGRDFPTETSDPGLGNRGGTGGSESSSVELQSVYFAFDDDSLTGDAKRTLRENAQVLRNNSSARLEVQGNTDERGTSEYNLALGRRRAEAARRYLVDLGVGASRVTTVSFGEENPAVRGSGESAWSKNRRDDFVLR
jgi:peptidoglycan-associated lipoprotein